MDTPSAGRLVQRGFRRIGLVGLSLFAIGAICAIAYSGYLAVRWHWLHEELIAAESKRLADNVCRLNDARWDRERVVDYIERELQQTDTRLIGDDIARVRSCLEAAKENVAAKADLFPRLDYGRDVAFSEHSEIWSVVGLLLLVGGVFYGGMFLLGWIVAGFLP